MSEHQHDTCRHRQGPQLGPLGHALSLFLAITYVLCVLWGLLVPADLEMNPAWARFLPGFEWLTWRGFFIGLVESYLYGWYIAVVFVPLYRVFLRRGG